MQMAEMERESSDGEDTIIEFETSDLNTNPSTVSQEVLFPGYSKSIVQQTYSTSLYEPLETDFSSINDGFETLKVSDSGIPRETDEKSQKISMNKYDRSVQSSYCILSRLFKRHFIDKKSLSTNKSRSNIVNIKRTDDDSVLPSSTKNETCAELSYTQDQGNFGETSNVSGVDIQEESASCYIKNEEDSKEEKKLKNIENEITNLQSPHSFKETAFNLADESKTPEKHLSDLTVERNVNRYGTLLHYKEKERVFGESKDIDASKIKKRLSLFYPKNQSFCEEETTLIKGGIRCIDSNIFQGNIATLDGHMCHSTPNENNSQHTSNNLETKISEHFYNALQYNLEDSRFAEEQLVTLNEDVNNSISKNLSPESIVCPAKKVHYSTPEKYISKEENISEETTVLEINKIKKDLSSPYHKNHNFCKEINVIKEIEDDIKITDSNITEETTESLDKELYQITTRQNKSENTFNNQDDKNSEDVKNVIKDIISQILHQSNTVNPAKELHYSTPDKSNLNDLLINPEEKTLLREDEYYETKLTYMSETVNSDFMEALREKNQENEVVIFQEVENCSKEIDYQTSRQENTADLPNSLSDTTVQKNLSCDLSNTSQDTSDTTISVLQRLRPRKRQNEQENEISSKKVRSNNFSSTVEVENAMCYCVPKNDSAEITNSEVDMDIETLKDLGRHSNLVFDHCPCCRYSSKDMFCDIETDEESKTAITEQNLSSAQTLFDLFSIDQSTSTGILKSLSNEELRSGALLTEIIRFLRQEMLMTTNAKTKEDVKKFLKAAKEAGWVEQKGNRYKLIESIKIDNEKITNDKKTEGGVVKEANVSKFKNQGRK